MDSNTQASNTSQTDVLIIGAGLTGLALAYFLRRKQIKVQVIEARERLGGRIHTSYAENQASIELGATWMGRQHVQLKTLLDELEIETFEQVLGERAIYEPISTSPPQVVTLPPNNDPSFRIKGGTMTIIEKLAAHLDADQIHLGQVAQSITQAGDLVTVKTNSHTYLASKVVSTLPPNLLLSSVNIEPALPATLVEVIEQTHTWMGESIKVGLRFKEPFWRKANSSGTIFSSVGPIPEMYDHTNFEDSGYALKGFLNGSYYGVTKEERQTIVLQQLRKYYGDQVSNLVAYEDAAWRNEPFTFAPNPTHVLPHQNNGHQAYQQAYLDGKFFIAGAETARQNPGYMEGAVRSAMAVADGL